MRVPSESASSTSCVTKTTVRSPRESRWIGSSAALSPMTGVAEREPEAFERFDALFPPKEKLRLPGQIF